MNWKALIPAILATASIILSLQVSLSCYYVSLVAPNGFIQHRGIWFIEGKQRIGDSDEFKNVCIPYPEILQLDVEWKATRFCALLGGIVGSAATSLLWSSVINPLTKQSWDLLKTACAMSCIFQGFTLLFVNSGACKGSDWILQAESRHCNTSVGFKTVIFATILWALTALIMVMFPPFLRSAKEKDGDTKAAPKYDLGYRNFVMPPTAMFGNAKSKKERKESRASVELSKASEAPKEPSPSDNDLDEVALDVDDKINQAEDGTASQASADFMKREDLPEVC